MISNSRPVTKNIAFGSELPVSTKVADSYSDSLMDDLFMDVDQILDGDLSSYMTVVGHNPKPKNPTTRTVKLPQNFSPQSAADIYRVTMAAANSQVTTHNSPSRHPVGPSQIQGSQAGQPKRSISSPPFNPPVYQSPSANASARRPARYGGGGRPVTSVRATAAQSGNFQSTVVHTPTGDHQGAPSTGLYGTTIDLHRVETSDNPVQSVSNYLYPNDPLPELTMAGVSPQSPQTIFEPKGRKKQQSVSLPFMLMGAAGVSAVSTVGLWVVSQSAPNNGFLASLSQEASAAELPTNSDEDFLEYLQQSLDVIATQQDAANQTVAVIPAAQTVPALPTTVPNTNAPAQLGALPNLPGAPASTNATTNVIERVFVPVYQNAPTAPAAAPTATASNTPPIPNVALPANAARPTVPVPAPVAAAAAIPPGAPVAATPSVPIVPNASGPNASESPATLPAPTVAVAPTNAAAAITNISPNTEHVLVGILNLGSRSAALFDLDGSSQRAYVGDRIGVSNWTLVSVNGQDVVVRRDGEVRSIYIGQRF